MQRVPERGGGVVCGWLGRLGACAALLLLATASVAAPRVGQRVTDVLADLERAGLRLIYSDDLVPDRLRVAAEPRAKGGIALAREVLAAHGLQLQTVAVDVYAVVAAPPADGEPPPAAAAIDEVIVSTSLFSVAEDRLQSHTFLTAAEAASLPKLADESLRAVHRLPGAASNGVSGLAYIRGGEANETEVVVDGFALAEPFHLKGFFAPVSVLDSAVIGSIDVYAGAFPARWGERMSAVMDLRSVTVPDSGIYELGISLFHTDAVLGDDLANGRARWLVSGRRSNLAELATLTHSDLGEPRYTDAFGRLDVDVTDRLGWSLRGLWATDDVELRNDPVTESADASYRNAYAWTTLDYAVADDLDATLLAGITSVRNSRRGEVQEPGSRAGGVLDRRDYRTSTLRLSVDWDDGDRSLGGGVEAARVEASYRYQGAMQFAADAPFPGQPQRGFIRQFDLDPDGAQYAAWLTGRWRFGEVVAEAGLRWSDQTYDDVDGRTQLAPRLGLLYTPRPDTRLRLGWGRFFQAQGIQELQVEDGVGQFFAPQFADHLIASVEHDFGSAMELRVEAWRKDYDALRPRFENLFDPFSILPELQADRVRVAPDGARGQGLELVLRRRSEGPVDWWLAYAWSEARDRIDGQTVPRSWEQRHSLNAGLGYLRGPWSLNLASTWRSGWPTTDASLAPGGNAVVVGPRNGIRFTDFLSVDLRAGYTATLGRTELEGFVEVTNVLARRNPCCSEFTVVDDGSGTATLARDLDYWPRIIPNLGLRLRF